MKNVLVGDPAHPGEQSPAGERAGLVLALLVPAWRHLLVPDSFGGRAPRTLGPFTPLATKLEPMPGRDDLAVWSCPQCGQHVRRLYQEDPSSCPPILHLPACPLWSLVLYASAAPLAGRRGLLVAAEAVDPRGAGFRLTAEYDHDVYLELLGGRGEVIRRFWSDDLPWLIDNRAEIRNDPDDQGLLAEAVAACLIHLKVATMWLSDRKRAAT